MSKTSIIVLVVVVLALLAGGAYYWFEMRPGAPTDQQENSAYSNQGPATTATLPSGTNTSDTALQQDAASIDAQLKGLDSDNANVNQSVSAQAAAQ